MQTTIQKWGNSLAVRIPKAFVKESHFAYGTAVDLSVNDGRIVIDPHPKPEYRLEDLLKGVTKTNIHAEIGAGDASEPTFGIMKYSKGKRLVKQDLRWISITLLLIAGLSCRTYAEKPLSAPELPVPYKVQPRFILLKSGAVKPNGWLKDWARAAANGITGHLDERSAVFEHGYKGYHFEAKGVKANGTGWPLEQCAYWLDGMVRLAYILDDKELIQKAKSRLDPVVDGVLNGGESFIYWRPKSDLNNAFNNWAHSHMGRALVAYYQATGDKRILDALVKVYSDYPLPSQMAENFNLPVTGACNIDPMLETYLMSGDKHIMDRVLSFANDDKFKQLVQKWADGEIPFGHTVIYYENARIPALLYQWTGDMQMLKASQQALDLGIKYHGLPIGLTSGEEFLAGIGATRHLEACNVACGGWTYMWMLSLTGNQTYADRMEGIFFNAGPATVARDFQTMAYYQCPNQMGEFPKDSPARGGTREFNATAGHVLCCVGNSNRIIPNYIKSMWMGVADGGFAATLYGPNTLQTEAADGTRVVIESDTTYPFGEDISITVSPEKDVAFPLYLRIPSWCQDPQLHLNGGIIPAKPDDLGFVKIDRLWKKGDRIELNLPMHVNILKGRETPIPETKYFRLRQTQVVNNPFASVSYGPLLFALAIPDKDSNTPEKDAKWNYALDIDPVDPNSEAKVTRTPLPDKWCWQLDAPIKLQIPVREFDWKPTELQPLPQEPITAGQRTEIWLVPYGCTKFRLSMFPVTTRTWGKGELTLPAQAGKRD